jgi:hypothetical protein
MASDCNFTCDDLKAIENALAKGVKTVKYVDKEVTYRSVDEMLKIRDLMRQCLGIGTDNNGTRGRRRVSSYNKALC